MSTLPAPWVRAPTDIRSTPHMAIPCRVNVAKTAAGYACYPVHFHRDSLPFCMETNGLYVCPVGESGRGNGEPIEVELLRGEYYLEDCPG